MDTTMNSNVNIFELPSKISKDICCAECGKGYKTKTNYQKHLMLCDLIAKGKQRSADDEILDNLPSQKTMYKMILELGQKYNRLEERMNEVNKWVVKKRKKIDVLEWLNATVKPEYIFDDMIDNIHITDSNIEIMFNNTVYDTYNAILCIELQPIFAFIQKPGLLYAFLTNDEGQRVWRELPKEKLIRFLKLIHLKITRALFEWKKKHLDINSSDSIATMFDKTTCKLMLVDFNQDYTLSRFKNIIYSRLKTDVKTMIEYEFE